jgi:hypothetical protein
MKFYSFSGYFGVTEIGKCWKFQVDSLEKCKYVSVDFLPGTEGKDIRILAGKL